MIFYENIYFSNYDENLDINYKNRIYAIYNYHNKQFVVLEEKGDILNIPIFQGNTEIATILLHDTRTELEDYQNIVIEDVATMLSIEIIREQSIETVGQQFSYNMLDQLIFSENIDENFVLKNYMKNCGFNNNGIYIISIIELSDISEVLFDNYTIRSFVNKLERYLKGMISEEELIIVRPLNNCLHILWKLKTKSSINGLMECVLDRLNKDLKKEKYYIGSGESVEDIKKLHICYKQAKDAVKDAKLFDKNYIDYEKLGILKLLVISDKNNKLYDFVPDILKKIIEYDEENGTEYFNTIVEFYKNNCNAASTAKQLYIHYKTILHRIDRIYELFNLDIRDYSKRLELEIGIKILKFSQK